MKVICNKNDHGRLCIDCKHSIIHDALPTCIGSLCITYCLQFAYENIMCDVCSLKDSCIQYENGTRLSLFNRGEECNEYRKLKVFAKCKQVDNK